MNKKRNEPPKPRDTPTATQSTTRHFVRRGIDMKRITVWLPVELAEALRELAHDEWRARPEPRGREDASLLIERLLRADPAMAEWLARSTLLPPRRK